MAKPYRNWSNVKVTVRFRLAGLPRTGKDALSAENGNGSTPRLGAGSIETVPAASPRPATIWASRPPNEWPMTTGFRFRPSTTAAVWSATSATEVPASESGFACASAYVAWSPGH